MKSDYSGNQFEVLEPFLKKNQNCIADGFSLDFSNKDSLLFKQVFLCCDNQGSKTYKSENSQKKHTVKSKSSITFLSFVMKQDLSCLTLLKITGCSIFSIQSIANLKSPLIWTIDFSYNHIVSLKPLAKLNFSRLNSIIIDNNHFQVNQLEHLAKTKLKFYFQSIIYTSQSRSMIPNFFVKINCDSGNFIKNTTKRNGSKQTSKYDFFKRRFHQCSFPLLFKGRLDFI